MGEILNINLLNQNHFIIIDVQVFILMKLMKKHKEEYYKIYIVKLIE